MEYRTPNTLQYIILETPPTVISNTLRKFYFYCPLLSFRYSTLSSIYGRSKFMLTFCEERPRSLEKGELRSSLIYDEMYVFCHRILYYYSYYHYLAVVYFHKYERN